jgi:hypothetical protein
MISKNFANAIAAFANRASRILHIKNKIVFIIAKTIKLKTMDSDVFLSFKSLKMKFSLLF